jgi:hypothetical protein
VVVVFPATKRDISATLAVKKGEMLNTHLRHQLHHAVPLDVLAASFVLSPASGLTGFRYLTSADFAGNHFHQQMILPMPMPAINVFAC